MKQNYPTEFQLSNHRSQSHIRSFLVYLKKMLPYRFVGKSGIKFGSQPDSAYSEPTKCCMQLCKTIDTGFFEIIYNITFRFKNSNGLCMFYGKRVLVHLESRQSHDRGIEKELAVLFLVYTMQMLRRIYNLCSIDSATINVTLTTL